MRILSFKFLAAILATFAALQTGIVAANNDQLTGVHSEHHGLLSQHLHQKLNLTPELETQWQQLKEQQVAMRNSMRESHRHLRTEIDTEMVKPQPDLAAIDNAMNIAHEANYAAHKGFRQKMLAFYSALTPERQAVVINALKAKHRHANKWRKGHQFRE